jgi:membrane protein
MAKRKREQERKTLSPARRLTTYEIVLRVWEKLFEDQVFGRAAQLAYYWFFSLFPLLIFLTTLLAFLPVAEDVNQWISALETVLPVEAYALVRETLDQIINRPRHGLLSFSILVVLWSSSSGMEAIMSALNTAFDVKSTRAWWKERLLAVVLTLGLAVFIIMALIMIFFGGTISLEIANTFGYGHYLHTLWQYARWPLIIVSLLLALELIYYFAPNIRRGKDGQRWEWFTPGTLFALTTWLLISFGMRFYLSRFSHYNATYGALGSVMVLMLWLYFTGVAILVGGEINSVMRKSV